MPQYKFKVVEKSGQRYLLNCSPKHVNMLILETGAWSGTRLSKRPLLKIRDLTPGDYVPLGKVPDLGKAWPWYALDTVEYSDGSRDEDLVTPVEELWYDQPIPGKRLELSLESAGTKPEVVFEP